MYGNWLNFKYMDALNTDIFIKWKTEEQQAQIITTAVFYSM